MQSVQPVSVHIAVLAVGKDAAPTHAISELANARGHQVVARATVHDAESSIRAQLQRWLDDANVDVVIVSGGVESEHTGAALRPLISQTLPGFTDLFRYLAFQEIGASAMLSNAEAAQCGSTFVFVLPASEGAVRAAMDKLILPQLDPATTPKNLVASMPRLRARSDDAIPLPIAKEKTASGSGLAPKMPSAPVRQRSATGANVIRKVTPETFDPPTKPIDVARLEEQIALSGAAHNEQETVQIDLSRLPAVPPGADALPEDTDILQPVDSHVVRRTATEDPADQAIDPPSGPRRYQRTEPAAVVPPPRNALLPEPPSPRPRTPSGPDPIAPLPSIAPVPSVRTKAPTEPPPGPRTKQNSGPIAVPSVIPMTASGRVKQASGAFPLPREKQPSGPVPVARTRQPSGQVPAARSREPSGSTRERQPSGPVPVARERAPSGPVPVARERHPSGPVPAARPRHPSGPSAVVPPRPPTGSSPVSRPPTAPPPPPGRPPTEPPPAPKRAPTQPPPPIAVPLPAAAAMIAPVPPAKPPVVRPAEPDLGALVSAPLPRKSGNLPSGNFAYPVKKDRPGIGWLFALIGAAALGFVIVVVVVPRLRKSGAAPATPSHPVVAAVPSDAAVDAPGSSIDESEISIDPTPSTHTPPRPTTPTPRPRPTPGPTPTPGPVTRPDLGSAATTGSATPPPVGSDLDEAPTNTPPGKTDCDEVSCVLSKYDRPCCERFKPAQADLAPRAGGVPQELDKSMVRQGIEKIKPRVVACGEHSADKGTVKVSVTVKPDGSVGDASIVTSPTPALGQCVEAAMKKAEFGKSVNGGSFTYPFVF